MGSKSNYLENKVLDHVLGGADYARPGTLYVELYTDVPSEAGVGTEVTGGAYARASVLNNAANFPASVGSSKSNANAIAFPTATANWGTVVGFAIFDNASGGNCLFAGALAEAFNVNAGATFSFQAGQLVFTED